jgi:SNF2 family DNA or RNA helicase
VLGYWHEDVGDILEAGLGKYGVVRLDGSTAPQAREGIEAEFRRADKGIFLGQIRASAEAIDLSAANELWVVEIPSSPALMAQISKRITNVGQTRSTFIKVCCIEGSIDEKIQAALMRHWTTIREVTS